MMRAATLAALLVLVACRPSAAADDSLHLAVGDPARRDREVPLVLDAVTDTRTGALLTPAELASRLAGARLVIVGESHTDMDVHRAQLRLVEELHRAGRQVLVGLEMFPATEQEHLDRWTAGLLTEEGFVRLSRWYGAWGYHWGYYREIFLFARDHRLPMVAINAPREVIGAVRRQGLAGLTPEQAAHLPHGVDTASAEHRTLLRALFGGGGSAHGGMSDEQLEPLVLAQAAWDAAMAANAVRGLAERGAPGSVMVVLAGSGHAAYGLGIQRQAARFFDGSIATVIPIPVRDEEGEPAATVRASYADFVWGMPPATEPLHPTLGLSTEVRQDDGWRRVLFVSEGSAAARVGVEAGDLVLAFDGAPLPDREALNRAVAGKRWGDAATLTVRRGERTLELPVLFRRQGRVGAAPGE